MSLFDLQDVCIAIGSLATLDLPMVVDLIGIYGLKGPYCTPTTTDWFLQALSVIPRGSWDDVARRFTMIRWASPELQTLKVAASPPLYTRRRRHRLALPPPRVAGIHSGRFDEENPFVQNLSALLVHPDEGVLVLVMDRIGDYLPQSTEKSRVLVIPVGARHKCQQDWIIEISRNSGHATAACGGALSFPPRAHARATTMRAGRAWWLETALHDAQALRMRRPRTAALPRACDARWPRSCGAPIARLARGGRPLVAKAARSLPLLADRCRCLDALARSCACSAAIFLRGGAAGRPAAAPAMLRRCRDGWSDFF
ncbi:putative polyamine oxidase 4-like [Dorcoceras hygrometricum]|uniref:Putative polyamine oxidase 4-like n=1 Tax=Dorcoceras hygrometricum TaxID=472368 RepID=A0A2Z7ANJ4_9LAMI|nr:putative polyamine oxidase 4-like [Dorcoceras hygrometricum]